jgi:multicomponent Na+:H+ antiporter subunit E
MTLASLPQVPVFLAWYAVALLSSAASVLRTILTPRMRPPLRVVQVPLAGRRDWQVVMFGGIITLTPGTLTVGVVHQGGERFLLVHSMQHDSNEEALASLHDMEARMLRAFPGRGRD